jgi:hypothetical protein
LLSDQRTKNKSPVLMTRFSGFTHFASQQNQVQGPAAASQRLAFEHHFHSQLLFQGG